MKAVIMAGGKGIRMADMTADTPKPMLRIDGKPVLQHQIEALSSQGITEVILTVGYLGYVIMDYFGDGSAFGVKLQYYLEQEPLGNAGALFRMKSWLNEDFLLLNGDLMFDIDFDRLIRYHREKGALVTLFTHPNSHPFDSGLIFTNACGQVVNWITSEEERPRWYRNQVNAGIHVISPRLLERNGFGGKVDLDRQLLKPLCGTGKMYACQSPEYVKDMGTPERFREVCQDYISGKVQAGNLKQKQQSILMDRDGTINRYVGFLRKPEDLELLEGVAQAIGRINRSSYLALVVTNQPVIARGEVTFETLQRIHNKMETLLGEKGAYVDGIYFCPHHPQKGFPGEIGELKVECDCRKPKPGMLLQAAGDYHLDLKNSWMVGDGEADIQAGKAAGCKTALIGNENYGQDISCTSLLDFVNQVLH